jgi:drug/metabolite transporter (DMT)-like permease
MIAILGGLGAAAAWALSTLCSSRSSRLLDPPSVVAWVMLVGLVVSAPIALSEGIPASLHGSTLVWWVLAGAGNVGGLVLGYAALRTGQVGLVAPLLSTEGAIAAVMAIIAGERLAPAVAVALAVIAVGVVLAAVASRSRPQAEPGWSVSPESSDVVAAKPVGAVVLAIVGALVFGISLYATGRAGSKLPLAWVVLSARLVGALGLAAPLALAGRLHVARGIVPLVGTAALCEVAGFFSFAAGARHGIAVAAVLSSQFAALAALGAYLLFKERLGRIQLAGVATVAVGVALLSAVRA